MEEFEGTVPPLEGVVVKRPEVVMTWQDVEVTGPDVDEVPGEVVELKVLVAVCIARVEEGLVDVLSSEMAAV